MRMVICVALVLGLGDLAMAGSRSEVQNTKGATAEESSDKHTDEVAQKKLSDKEQEKLWKEFEMKQNRREAIQDIRSTGM